MIGVRNSHASNLAALSRYTAGKVVKARQSRDIQEMNYENSNEISLDDKERELFIGLYLDYSQKKIILRNNDYWNIDMWTELAFEYNKRARRVGLSTRPWFEVLKAGGHLKNIFTSQKKRRRIEEQRFLEMFEPCSACMQRIPISLLKTPTAVRGSGSLTLSSHGYSRARSHQIPSHSDSIPLPPMEMEEVIDKLMTRGDISVDVMCKALKLSENWSAREMSFMQSRNVSLENKCKFFIRVVNSDEVND